MKWIPCGTDATFILATGSVTLSSDSYAYKLAPKKNWETSSFVTLQGKYAKSKSTYKRFDQWVPVVFSSVKSSRWRLELQLSACKTLEKKVPLLPSSTFLELLMFFNPVLFSFIFFFFRPYLVKFFPFTPTMT